MKVALIFTIFNLNLIMATLNKKCLVMIGTSKNTRGGISSVVRAYENAGLFDKYSIEYISTHLDKSFLVKLVYSFAAVFKYIWLCISKNVCLVHIHTASNFSFWRKSLFYVISKLFSRKVIFHIHGGGFANFYTKTTNSLGRRIIKRILQDSSAVIVLSENWNQLLRTIIGLNNVVTLHNPVTDTALTKAVNVPRGERFVFLGLIKLEKGIFDIISAMQKLRDDYEHNVMLDICGVGDTQALLKEINLANLRDNVVIHGWVGSEKIKELFESTTAFLLPSYIEGLPMSSLEAMAAGVPVIASDVGGIPDVIVDNINGFLIKPGDIQALANNMKMLLDDHDMRKRIANAAREKVLNEYEQGKVVSRLLGIYSEVLNEDVNVALLRDASV